MGGCINTNTSSVLLTAIGVVATTALAALATIQPSLSMAIVVATAFVVLTAFKPAFGLVAWLVLVALVPDWTPISLGGINLRPSIVIGLPVLAGLLLSRKRSGSRLALPDFALAGAVVLVLVLTVLESYPTFLIINLGLVLVLSYTLGRLSPDEVKTAFVVVMMIVAVWGMFEFVTRLHVWTTWSPSVFHHWGDVQTRAGLDRSEAGFGHAIAYGASIAMAIPFARDLKRHSALAQVVLAGGVVASFSRGPMLALVLTFGLSIFAVTHGRRRLGAFLLFGMSMVAILVVFQLLYSEDDASDVRLSGEQRSIQLERALPAIKWLGASAGVQVDQTGRLQSAAVDVIDNTLLRLGANFGWIVAVLVLAPILYAAVQFFRRRVTPASVALLGQIPVLAVTSLITQWQAILFFIAGIAVTELVLLSRASNPVPDAASEPQGSPPTVVNDARST